MTICALYKRRGQVEVVFKWIKQHLHIKSFLGTTENAVKTQIWIAFSTHARIAIVKKKLHMDHSLHEMLRVLNLNPFETTAIPHLLAPMTKQYKPTNSAFQGSAFSRWDSSGMR